MALVQDSTGYYLEPSTGQYYSPYTVPTYNNRMSSLAGFGMTSYQPQPAYGLDKFTGSAFGSAVPQGIITVDGKSYKPFSGDATGISQGKRSVVDALVGGRQPYEYNVPSLASMFPSLQGQMQAPMQGNNMQAPSSGAGRFMGGLLGSMPTPVSSTTTQAPSTSGAGRFL